MKKYVLITALLFVSMELFGVRATVVRTSGSVKVRRGTGWVKAARGMVLPAGATISTGFRAAAVVRIMPTGTMVRVNQFTTVSINKLGQQGKTVATRLKLKVGTVRAVVKNTVKSRSRFSISTPVATASVRGTIPEVSHFPGIGTRVAYLQGHGTVMNRRGRVQILRRMQQSSVGRSGVPTTAADELKKKQAAAAIRFNLNPVEEGVIFRDSGNRFGAAGPAVGHFFNNIKDQLKLQNLLIKPRLL